MKKIILICVSLLLLNNCTDEADEHTYITRFKNVSSTTIEIKGYDSRDNLVFDETILTNNTSSDCTRSAESFLGISCNIVSVEIKFNNNKGYVCGKLNTNGLCFLNEKSPLGNDPSFVNLANYTYEFVITQEDFENAYDLP
ncbi:MAG TPA: hypothetical protein DEO36_09590 [Flavobacteriaceae bacterium]|jgi:hypothetical protein|nr:hypothetical protein [Flavobacteriaceae bacterium]